MKGCNYRGCSNNAEYYNIWLKLDGRKSMNDGLCSYHNNTVADKTFEECEDGKYFSIPIAEVEAIKECHKDVGGLSLNRLAVIDAKRKQEREALVNRKINFHYSGGV